MGRTTGITCLCTSGEFSILMNMSNMKEVYRVKVVGKVWRASNRFIIRVEPPGSKLLMEHVGSKAIASIHGLNIEFRTAVTQWNRGTVVLTLPAALNPTWERLWRSNDELIIELAIEGKEEARAVSETA